MAIIKSINTGDKNMKKTNFFGIFSALVLAVSAGAAISASFLKGETTPSLAASSTFIIIGDHQAGGWNNTDNNFAMTQVDGQYEFKNIHWTSGQNWRITWAGEWGQYAGWSTLQSKEGMEAGAADNNIKTTREWYYDVYFKNNDGNKIYLANAAYTVTLHKDGGTVVSGDDLTGYSYSDTKTLPTLSKEGYTFDGFYDNQSFTGSPVTGITSKDNGNKEFYAKFTKITTSYSISYNSNGGLGEMENSVADPTKDFNIPASEFTKEGMKQVGWATSESGEVAFTATIPANTYKKDDDITLYAVWEETEDMTVYFTNNKGWEDVGVYYWGSSTPCEKWPGQEAEFAYINENSEVVYKALVPEDVDGLIFNSFEESGSQTENITQEKLTANNAFYCKDEKDKEDHYLVGGWNVTYVTICYNLNGGTGEVPAEFQGYRNAQGVEVNDGSTFTKGGLVFDHWNSKADGTGELNSFVGDDEKTYVSTVGLSENQRVELHAIYKEAPLKDGLYLGGSMIGWTQEGQYNMVHNPGVDPEVNEFVVYNVTLKDNDEIKVYNEKKEYLTISSVSWSHPDYKGEITETDGNCKVLKGATYHIYFNTDNGNMHLQNPEMPENGRYLYSNASDEFFALTEVEGLSGKEYLYTGNFTKDDVISAYYQDSSVAILYKITTSEYSEQKWANGEKGVIVPEDGIYSIYLISKDGENYDEVCIYAGDPTKAIAFAKQFNSDLEKICVNDGSTNLETLRAKWAEEAAAFALLDDDSKAILKVATTTTSNEDLAKFADKYDFIYGKYGGDVGANFADRAVPNFSNMRSLLSSYNQNAGLIVVIALACAIPLLVGTAFIIKKKKHN